MYTGAKVSCNNLKYIIHNYTPYTYNFCCPIQLTASLATSESTLLEGEGYLRVSSLTTQGYIDIKTYYFTPLESTLIIENSILTTTNSKKKYFLSQTIKTHLPTEISKGYMTINCHHQNNRAKGIVLHGILIGGKLNSNPLIIPDIHPYDPHADIDNYMKYDMLHESEFAHLCNK